VAADITAIVLVVACAAIAGWCGRLVLRLWGAGQQQAQSARERARP
jgi:nitrogen fixation protein FixH